MARSPGLSVGTDVVDLLDIAHAALLYGGIGEVPDDDVVDTQGA